MCAGPVLEPDRGSELVDVVGIDALAFHELGERVGDGVQFPLHRLISAALRIFQEARPDLRAEAAVSGASRALLEQR